MGNAEIPLRGGERIQPKVRDRGVREVAKKANALERLTVTYVAVGELKPNSYNPNRQSEKDFELLCRSMKEDGFTQPIVALQDGNVIVDGEHRWRAARKLGYEKVPVVFVNMTLEQMRISTLRHNRARGSEDTDLSAELLRDLRELGALDWAQDSLMLGDEEMQILLDDIPITEVAACDEFSESFVHSKHERLTTVELTAVNEDKNNLTAATPSAVQAFKTLETAKSKGDEQTIKEIQSQAYRVAVSYTGEEADVVKKALGFQPAVKIVALCKKYENYFKGAVNG